MSSITINEIEGLFKLIIEKLKRDKLNQIELNTDEYWIITSDEWSVEETPKPAVGSLKEDIEYLKRAIEEGAIYSYSDFDRLAIVLRAISEMQAPIA
jgi:hypothetical protein